MEVNFGYFYHMLIFFCVCVSISEIKITPKEAARTLWDHGEYPNEFAGTGRGRKSGKWSLARLFSEKQGMNKATVKTSLPQ